MEIPSAHFGRKAHRVVPDDAIVRVELRLPAPFVAKLSTESAKRGCSMSHVMTQWLSEAGRFRGDDSQGAGGCICDLRLLIGQIRKQIQGPILQDRALRSRKFLSKFS